MKCIVKKLFVIALFSITVLSPGEGVHFGAKAGNSIADLHGDAAGGMNSTIRRCGGIHVAFTLGNGIIIQPEILYVQKGAEWEFLLFLEYSRGMYRFDYLDIPVLLKVPSAVKERVKPCLFTGPYLGVNLSARYRLEQNGTLWLEGTEYAKDTEFGVVFGGAVDFVLGRGAIVFDGRFTLGLTSVSDRDFDMKNNVISFRCGYSF